MGIFSKKLKIAVLVSGRGSNLTALHKACKSRRVNGKIILVLSDNPDAPALDYCRENRIHGAYVSPGKFKTKLEGPAEENYIKVLKAAKPDLIVMAGFMRVIKPKLISSFPNQIINIHPSLLPKFPGLHTHRRALEAGETESGCTVHFVNEVVDGGKRILQARVPISDGDTEEKIALRVLKKEHLILPAVVEMFARGKINYETWPDQPLLWQDGQIRKAN